VYNHWRKSGPALEFLAKAFGGAVLWLRRRHKQQFHTTIPGSGPVATEKTSSRRRHMAPPTGIYVDIVHSTTPNGAVEAGQDFMWYNSGGNNNCSVTSVGTWCEKASYGPIGAGASLQGHALSGAATGTYSFVCPCCMVMNPSVGVHNLHEPGSDKGESAA
jgi:hypothetical protein